MALPAGIGGLLSAHHEHQVTSATYGGSIMDAKMRAEGARARTPSAKPIVLSTNSNYFASVLVVGLRTAPFYGITHLVQYKNGNGRHALSLFGTERFVEWLPGLG